MKRSLGGALPGGGMGPREKRSSEGRQQQRPGTLMLMRWMV